MLRQMSILDMFARSPMRPLQCHMRQAHACVQLLLEFYPAVQQKNWEQASALYHKISEKEREADKLKVDLRLHLPKGLFLPVPRGDLLELLSQQESLANLAKDIAGIMLGRKMVIPPALDLPFASYLQRSVDASKQAGQAIDELDELLESGFRGKEVSFVEDLINDLNTIEHETDQMQIALRDSLFQIEKELQPIDVMFLYEVIEWVGEIANCAQQTGYQLQLLLAD